MIMASDEPTDIQLDFEDPQVGASLHATSDDQLDDHGLVDMQLVMTNLMTTAL